MATFGSVTIERESTTAPHVVVRNATSTENYASGSSSGYAEGYDDGHDDGYAEGYTDGLAASPAPSSPTIAVVSPAPGAIAGELEDAQQTPHVIDVDQVGAFAVSLVVVVVRYPEEDVERTAYRRGSFRRGFTAHSYAETIGTKTRLHILPDGGWPDSGDPDDIVIDVDAAAGALSDIGASS